MSHTLQWERKKRGGDPPAVPAQPVATNVTGNGATLSWVAVPTTTFYTLQRSDDDGATWADVYVGSDLMFDDSGLSAAKLYYYQLMASNNFDDSAFSPQTLVTLDTPTPPATPAAPTVDAFAVTTISLSWTAVATATTYTLQRSITSGSGFSTIKTGNVLSFVDSGLTAATTYFYRLSATNADGTSAYSAETSQATAGAITPPAAPGQPTASNITSSSVNIAWTAVASATDYELQRRQIAPTTTTFATIYGPGPNLSFLNTGLAASSTYEYKVRASNSAGTSAYSTVRQVITGGVTGTNVQPVSMLYLRQNNGAATHPNFNAPEKVWKTENAAEYIELIYQGGWGYIRGAYSQPGTFLPLLKARKMKWIAGIVGEASGSGVQPPTNDTIAQTRATVRSIRENPDAVIVVAGIEGINEPNDNRGDGTTSSNWANITMQHQRAIYQEAKWNLMSVNGPIGSTRTEGSILNPLRFATIWSPSLHDIACENSYSNNPPNDTGPRHWHQLVDEGILPWQEGEGMHSYPGAGIPLRGSRNRALLEGGSNPANNAETGNVTGRYELMWTANGQGYPSMTTEWGYHNALAQLGGHEPIDERGAGIYYPRGAIQLPTTPFRIGGVGLTNNIACTGFEFLDDQDDGPFVSYGSGTSQKTSQELNFGIYGYVANTDNLNPNNWRPKPAYTETKKLLTHGGREPLDDPDYVPSRVFLKVTTTASPDYLEWQVLATKAMSDAGTAFVAIYRVNRCWDRGGNQTTGTVINVPTIPVTIEDRAGVHPTTYQIGAPVTLIDLR